MALTMDSTMETFYTSLLAYAGLKQEDDGAIANIDEKFGKFTLDNAPVRLPYLEYLKNPQGCNFMHLLNESFTSPDTAMFSL